MPAYRTAEVSRAGCQVVSCKRVPQHCSAEHKFKSANMGFHTSVGCCLLSCMHSEYYQQSQDNEPQNSAVGSHCSRLKSEQQKQMSSDSQGKGELEGKAQFDAVCEPCTPAQGWLLPSRAGGRCCTKLISAETDISRN